MQYWMPEILAETRCDDFRREIEQINLVREAMSVNGPRQGWIELRLHSIGHWMMAVGERLHQRYDAPEPLPRWYQSSTLAR